MMQAVSAAIVLVRVLVNKVGDEGATALAEAWKRCPELRDVDLASEWCSWLVMHEGRC